MTNKIQNIVFVGDPCFPNGGAMTKRWRYLVDFLNDLKSATALIR